MKVGSCVENRTWALLCLVLSGVAGCADSSGGEPWAGPDGGGSDGASSGANDGPGDGGSEGEGEGDDGSDGDDGPIDDPGDPFDPVPDPEPLPPERVDEIAQAIDALLTDGAVASASKGILVVDLETDQTLYERNPDQLLIPASNTKMFTTAFAFDALGEDHRMETGVWADAAPDASGVVQGDIYLVGTHDFTWSTYFYGSARFPLDRIAERLYLSGVREVAGTVHVTGEFLYEGDTLGTYDSTSQRSAALSQFTGALAAVGISYAGSTTGTTFEPPAGAVELTSWQSPPLSVGCVHLNGPSHNEFADILARHLGWSLGGESSYTAGGAEMVDWMASIGSSIDGVSWNDGSGLSHGNQISARHVVELVRFMSGQPEGAAWNDSMAVAGYRGTLASRMTGSNTIGRVFGKTGTLPSIGAVATSGTLFNVHDGHRIAFSILMNGVSSVDGARAIQDGVVGAASGDLRELGPRPAAPLLRSVRGASNSDVVEIAWDAVEGADAYVVWFSPDGHTWSRDDARLVEGTSHRAGELEFGPAVYVRVSGLRFSEVGPLFGFPSDVYGSVAEPGAAPVLVVDGNDRWESQPQPENSRGDAHDFAVAYGEALDGVAFDTVSNDAVLAGEVDLSGYAAVLWMLGEESDVDVTFDAAEQSAIASYLEGGGAIMVSGAEVGYDLVAEGTPDDVAFFEDVLRASYAGDAAGTYLAGRAVGLADGLPDLGFNTPGKLVADYADLLAPIGGSEPMLEYVGGSSGVAGLQFSGEYRVVVLGFPVETIDNRADRSALLGRVLEFFGVTG